MQVNLLTKHDLEHAQALGEHREKLGAHDQQFSNGRHVMGDLNSRLGAVEVRTMPKPPSITKIVGITLTCVLAGASALWGLSTKLSDRPTMQQIERAFDKHAEAGHRQTTQDIGQIHQQLGQQKLLIENIDRQQNLTGRKLDDVLSRLPNRR